MKSRIIKDQNILTKFESSIADAAIKKGADTVICGHTHFPVKKTIATANGTVNYINCGDWVENFTSAEYSEGVWYLSSFNEADIILDNTPDEELIPDNNIVIQSILEGISTS
jgi:UDP-2,3-diacylglucosamine pyrophosphatase LpxH